jgi:succinyl-diaminopimelate desuccinylase
MKSVEALLAQLVQTPSQALVNDLGAVVKVVTAWLDRHGVAHTLTTNAAGQPDAIVINPPEADDDEVWMLNACVDTAPVGDLGQWRHLPFAATVEDGWLYGRGSSDSKAAVALFCELARSTRLTGRAPKKGSGERRRRVTVVFDCDEHSGRFGGIRSATQRFGFPQHCAIGYPGMSEIVTGSRGFHRSTVTLRGAMGHSGAETVPTELAADKLQRLLKAVSDFNARKPAGKHAVTADFPIPPRASVTGLRTGAKTHSVTASKIECLLDIRVTPAFDVADAQAWLDKTLAQIARACGDEHPSSVSRPNTWPPYHTPHDALLPRLMETAAAKVLGTAPPLVVCGPGNIGNFLSSHGTQVLCGFGVEFRNAHGPDECARLSTLAPVFKTYRAAVQAFVGGAV